MSRLSSNFLSCRCIGYHQVLIHVSLPVILQVLTNVSLPSIIHVPTLLVYRFTNTFLSCQLTGYHTSSYSCQFTGYTGSYSYQFTGYHLRFYTWQWTCYIQVLTNVNVPATQQLLTHAGVSRSPCKFLPVSVYRLLLIVLHKFLPVSVYRLLLIVFNKFLPMSPYRLSQVLTYIRQILTQVSVPAII